MFIWIAVVATMLALVGMAGIFGIALLCKEVSGLITAIEKSGKDEAELERTRAEGYKKLEAVFSDFLENLTSDLDRARDEWRQASTPLFKSQEELADSLRALLREIKVSKQLAQGTAELGEQTVLAIDKLWKLIELIRSGPRTPTNIAPTDEQIAEGPESEAQQRAMLDMLQGVAARVRGELNESQE